jgi:hypothetical protein
MSASRSQREQRQRELQHLQQEQEQLAYYMAPSPFFTLYYFIFGSIYKYLIMYLKYFKEKKPRVPKVPRVSLDTA